MILVTKHFNVLQPELPNFKIVFDLSVHCNACRACFLDVRVIISSSRFEQNRTLKQTKFVCIASQKSWHQTVEYLHVSNNMHDVGIKIMPE